jgi:hypothetical protein
MNSINRCVVIVKAKEPFLRWVKGLPDPSESVTLESLREDTSAYLLPEYADDRERDEILREFYEMIFDEELFGWWTDEQAHPSERTLQMFHEWFEIEFHSMVVDVLEDEIESEPL